MEKYNYLIKKLEYYIQLVYDTFSLIEKNINHSNKWKYSNHEYVFEKLKDDINEIIKDIKLIKIKKI